MVFKGCVQMKNYPLLFIFLLLNFFLLSCATLPDLKLILLETNDLYAHAKANHADQLAPDEFQKATLALSQAEECFKHCNPQDREKLAHKINIARTQMELALVATEITQNQQKLAQLKREKTTAISQRKQAALQMRAYEEKYHLSRERQLELREQELRSLLQDTFAELAKIKRTSRGLTISFSSVLFAFDKADLKSGAKRNLRKLSAALNQYPDQMILIEGHTDNVGPETYNLGLSDRRALSVKAFFQQEGISSSELVTRGYGEEFPIASNQTAEGRQQNRRVDIVILDPGKTPEDNFLDSLQKSG